MLLLLLPLLPLLPLFGALALSVFLVHPFARASCPLQRAAMGQRTLSRVLVLWYERDGCASVVARPRSIVLPAFQLTMSASAFATIGGVVVLVLFCWRIYRCVCRSSTSNSSSGQTANERPTTAARAPPTPQRGALHKAISVPDTRAVPRAAADTACEPINALKTHTSATAPPAVDDAAPPAVDDAAPPAVYDTTDEFVTPYHTV